MRIQHLRTFHCTHFHSWFGVGLSSLFQGVAYAVDTLALQPRVRRRGREGRGREESACAHRGLSDRPLSILVNEVHVRSM
jgi:hypothetical protein